MNWKEQLKRIVGDLNVADSFIPDRETVELAVLEKFSTEIIEKLIEGIPEIEPNEHSCEWKSALHGLKQELRDKWL